MVTILAGRLSLIAFATSALRSMMHGEPFAGALKAALLAATVFYVVGMICGELARRVVEEDARAEVERIIEENGQRNQ